MSNYFLENKDLQFHFENIKISEIVEIMEDNYTQTGSFDYAPVNYEDAIENYRKILEMVGDIAANFIAERAVDVDVEGAKYDDGVVNYASGTVENLKRLASADLMGLIFPRKYGG
jgi:3-(methylthio)propanoyl-CoA dehydrogenase